MWLTHAFTVRTKALLLQCSLLPSSIFTIIKLASKMYWSKRTFETCQLLCWLKQFSFDYEKVTERMQLWRGKALALDQSDCGRMYSPSNQMPETQHEHSADMVTPRSRYCQDNHISQEKKSANQIFIKVLKSITVSPRHAYGTKLFTVKRKLL